MKARDIEAVVSGILRPEFGIPSETDNGIVLGDARRNVSRLAVCWSPTAAVLEEAVRLGAGAVLSHEVPFIPVPEAASELWPVPHADRLPANRRRRRLCADSGLVLLKYHYPLDGWPVWGTPRALASALGFDPGRAEWINRFVPAFPCGGRPLAAVAEQVRHGLDLDAVSVTGPLDRPVHKLALAVGGFATRFWISEMARQAGCEALVVGDVLDYTARTAVEAGVALIRAGHYATENPAVIRLADQLQRAFGPNLPVTVLDSGHPWRVIGAEPRREAEASGREP